MCLEVTFFFPFQFNLTKTLQVHFSFWVILLPLSSNYIDLSACWHHTEILHGENHLALPATSTILWWLKRQQGKATCPRSHSCQRKPGIKDEQTGSAIHGLKSVPWTIPGIKDHHHPAGLHCTFNRTWRRCGIHLSVMPGRMLTLRASFWFVFIPLPHLVLTFGN